MTQAVRICKYGCNTPLAEFDTKQNKYLEKNGTLQTRERCEALKPAPKVDKLVELYHYECFQKWLQIGLKFSYYQF